MTLRPYQSSRRAEGVQATRRRILDAAAALFVDTDFHSVSVDEVAERAGVGRTTVFQQFGSKSALLQAVETDVSARAGVDRLLVELADPDGLRSLRAAFETGCQVWAAERVMFRRFRGLALVDEEMHEVMAKKDAGRMALIEELVKRLRRQKRLRGTPKQAADLLWLLTSFESFDALYERRPDAKVVASLLLELTAAFVELS